MVSDESISSTVSNKSAINSPTLSGKFITPADKLISYLSFSHIREILPIDDPLARFFYETECINWQYLTNMGKRQIRDKFIGRRYEFPR